MLNDDMPIGRILTRREAILLLGAAGMSLAGCPASSTLTDAGSDSGTTDTGTTATGGCVVRPELTEGPYFVDELLQRSDIRMDPSDGSTQTGVPLVLKFNISKIESGACSALAGAQVDVWHCNAGGLYSDESANHTVGRKFLRGYQLTDSNGAVEFLTIYPGWYSGRTAHIHFKIRTFSGSRQTFEFTSQLFFSDPLNDQVFAQSPYNTRGTRNTRNSNDNIYNSQMLLSPTQQDDGNEASFDIGLDLG